jgi:hypothetical protein
MRPAFLAHRVFANLSGPIKGNEFIDRLNDS